jgi:purine-nucleoside phosphorylase
MSGPGEVPVREASDLLRERLPVAPRVLVVLGSGLGPLADAVEVPVSVPFTDLPGFPQPTVTGHAGRWVGGTLEGCPVLVQQGRFHVYEGHAMSVVAAPVRVAAALGVELMVVTNAAGGIAEALSPGSLVVLDDHLNLQARTPLMGPVRAGETRFPDMSEAYDPELRSLALEAARRLEIRLDRGVYAAVTGPSYETPAEIRMLATLGADVVGMSTVPEVLVARALGLRCLGLSLVTNYAAGRSGAPLHHAEVMGVAREAGGRLEALVRAVLKEIA